MSCKFVLKKTFFYKLCYRNINFKFYPKMSKTLLTFIKQFVSKEMYLVSLVKLT